MKFVAKPKLNNTIGQRTFESVNEAVRYLEEYTGYRLDYVVDRRTKEKTWDWELIGKLKRIQG